MAAILAHMARQTKTSARDKIQGTGIPDDYNIVLSGHRRGGNASARVSRAQALTSETVEIIHSKTGISVTGEIPAGHYTKKQMQAAREKCLTALFSDIERRVAKNARKPGR